MFDLIVNEETSDRELLLHLMKEMKAMALDLSKLNASVAANSAALSANTAAVDQLIVLHTDPAAQSAVDAAVQLLDSNTAVLSAETAKVTAVVTPAPAPVA